MNGITQCIAHPPRLVTLPSCVFYARPYGNVGATTVKDWSSYHGTVTATNIDHVSSNFLKPSALRNDSAGYLSIPYNANFNYASQTSWAVAFNTYFYTSTPAGLAIILTNYDASVGGNGAEIYYNGSDKTINIYGETGDQLSWSWEPTLNRVAQIVIRRSGDTTTAYANGASLGDLTSSTYTAHTSNPLWVLCGRSNGNPAAYWAPACISELAVWNGALGPVPAITDLYPPSRWMIV